MEGRGGASQPLFVLQMFIRGKEKSRADFSFKFSAAVFQQVHDSLTAFLSALSCFAFLRLSSRSRLFLQPSSMCSLPAHPHLWLYARQPLTCSVKKQAQRREANRPPHTVCIERWRRNSATPPLQAKCYWKEPPPMVLWSPGFIRRSSARAGRAVCGAHRRKHQLRLLKRGEEEE